MSKILKFRAWHKEFQKFLTKEEWFLDFDGNLCFLDWNKTVKLHPARFIVSQFTGLQDKNNKEIYEGDILLRVSANFNYKYEVFWDTPEGSWKLKFLEEPLDYSIYLGDFSQKNLEVIGNIFQ